VLPATQAILSTKALVSFQARFPTATVTLIALPFKAAHASLALQDSTWIQKENAQP